MRELGWGTVLAIVRSISDTQAAEIMLAENTARVDLNPYEEAKAYRMRLDSGLTVNDIARSAAVPVTRVKRRLALLDLETGILTRSRPGRYLWRSPKG